MQSVHSSGAAGDAPYSPIGSRISAKPSASGETKFYELVADGKIKTVVIGGRRLIPAAEAQRLVRDGCE